MGADERLRIIDGDADTSVVAAYERDRRALLRRGLTIGGGVVVASTIPLLLGVRNAFAKATGDAGVLENAIVIEQAAVFAYTTALSNPALPKDIVGLITIFRDQEQQHADALIKALKALGGVPPGKPTSIAGVDKVVPGLGDVTTRAQALHFAVALETAAVAAYYDAQTTLQDGALLQTAASIMANEGQHLVILRQALRADPVPTAFETGAK